MSAESLLQAIPEGDRVLLDSSTLIAYLTGTEAVSAVATQVIDSFVREGRNVAIVSMVTVLELLVRPVRQRLTMLQQQITDFLTHFPNIELVEIDLPVALEGASQRALHNFSTPDALIIATGLRARAAQLVTNDEKWQRLAPHDLRIKVCYLDLHLPYPA